MTLDLLLFPKTRGSLLPQAPLDKMTWFRTGGCADYLFTPHDLEDLQYFLQERPKHLPITVIGLGSNLLVRDGGVSGIVIKLSKAFAKISGDQGIIQAGAAAQDRHVAEKAREMNLTGLEFLVGIPGVIGGALRMNAGAYGSEMKSIIHKVRALDDQGQLHSLSPDSMGFSYRHCAIPREWIFIDCELIGSHCERSHIDNKMKDIRQLRQDSQPLGTRTGGSTFANPDGHSAWQLIDQAGCRGLTLGDAMISEKHCNFLINKGQASAQDLENLGQEVIRRVFEHSGIRLEWEIQRIGRMRGESN
jgi:UDP-N-acetylmuramate dehydrogenase